MCDLELDPAAIDFGEVGVSGAFAVETGALRSVGTEACEIDGMGIDDESAAFSLGSVSSNLVGPGDQAQFDVRFQPDLPVSYAAYVLVEVGGETLVLPLMGTGG